jgi:hypothetical protein
MAEGPSPQLQEYLELQDSLKARHPSPEELLSLYGKAREAGLPREARHHLVLAGEMFTGHPKVRELLAAELGPEGFGKWEAERAPVTPFWRELGAIIRYPASPGTLTMLAIASLGLSLYFLFEDLMLIAPWLRVAGVPAFMAGGLAWFAIAIILPGFYRTIVWETAMGRDDFPAWPGMADIFGQVVLPTLKALLILLWSFLPVTIILTAALRASKTPSVSLLLLSLAFGCLYFPMAFLMFSVSNKLWPSLLPSNTVESIAKTFSSYLKLALLFWLMLAPAILTAFLALASIKLLHVKFAGLLLFSFISLYCWAAAMRLLGRFYRLEAGRLEWM